MNLFPMVFLQLTLCFCINLVYCTINDGNNPNSIQDAMFASFPEKVNGKTEAFDSVDIGCASMKNTRGFQKRNVCPAKDPRPLDDAEKPRKIAPQIQPDPATNSPSSPFAEDGACDDHSPHLKHLWCGGPIVRKLPYDSMLNCVRVSHTY